MGDATTKSRPIIFGGANICAILDGRKTMTRRVVKPQPDGDCALTSAKWYHPTVVGAGGIAHPGDPVFGVSTLDGEQAWRCPYGAPGDMLWVRETWAVLDMDDGRQIVAYRAGCDEHDCFNYVAADGTVRCIRVGPWKSPIHMPRWASRLTLRITDVRVERVTEISEADAQAEGVDPEREAFITANGARGHLGIEGYGRLEPGNLHRVAFARAWDAINGKRPGCAWADSPWVWVLGFERVEVADA